MTAATVQEWMQQSLSADRHGIAVLPAVQVGLGLMLIGAGFYLLAKA